MGDARLGKEDGEGVGHITLLHEVGDQADSQFESQTILSVLQIDVDSLILQAELVVELGAQLRLQTVQHTCILHRAEQLLLELVLGASRATGRPTGRIPRNVLEVARVGLAGAAKLIRLLLLPHLN